MEGWCRNRGARACQILDSLVKAALEQAHSISAA
jgi:hypothetical protein